MFLQGVCTEAGMYALRERRVHVTQEDFEMAVAKVMQKDSEKNMSIKKLWKWILLLGIWHNILKLCKKDMLIKTHKNHFWFSIWDQNSDKNL